MSILVDKNTRVICQGITGKAGSFHTRQMVEYGTKVVGGVSPGKGGTSVEGIPVFDTVDQAVRKTGANASVLFVPAAHTADAIEEAADAGVSLIVCITEGIPTLDMIRALAFAKTKECRCIGPNCPGIITPGQCKIGIMPGYIHQVGTIGVISRSGTLTYEAVYQLTQLGLGQSTCVGIGGDPVIGTKMVELLDLFEADPETNAIVMIGEIGGSMEIEAAHHVKKFIKKPVIGFIAGQTAPPGRRMGHAGAIVSGADESAAAKKKIMAECGIHVVDSPADIGATVKANLR